MEFSKIPVVFTACDIFRYKVNRKKGWHVEFNTNCQLVITSNIYCQAVIVRPADCVLMIYDTINFPTSRKLNNIWNHL